MTTTTQVTPRDSRYVDVNGVHMYVETYGDGLAAGAAARRHADDRPQLRGLIPTLAGRHRVIGVELQGHGRTADIDRPITPAALASDVVGMLDELGIDRAHVFGHSMGAAVALELAVNHGSRVRSVVAASVSVRPEGCTRTCAIRRRWRPPPGCPPSRTSPTSRRPTAGSRRTRSTSRSS